MNAAMKWLVENGVPRLAGVRSAAVLCGAVLAGGFAGLAEANTIDVQLPDTPGASVTFQVQVQRPANGKLDLFLALSAVNSTKNFRDVFSDLTPAIASGLATDWTDVHMGVGLFIDKPISPFGGAYGSSQSGDFEYAVQVPLGTDYAAVAHVNDPGIPGVATNPDFLVGWGGDDRNSMLTAVHQGALQLQTGWRGDSRRVMAVLTDEGFHVAGDFANAPDGPHPDGGLGPFVLENEVYYRGIRYDYPSYDQVRGVLLAEGITPVFFPLKTSVEGPLEELVSPQFSRLGFGAVVPPDDFALDMTSTAFLSAVESALSQVWLVAQGDDQGLIDAIVAIDATGIQPGEAATFQVTLSAKALVGDTSFELVSPGLETTMVNVTLVPEPASVLLLLVGSLGIARRRRRRTAA